MTTSPDAAHHITKPAEDLGTLLLATLHTLLVDPRTYPALNYGSAGQIKDVRFFRTNDGKPKLNRLDIETTAGTFTIGIDEYSK